MQFTQPLVEFIKAWEGLKLVASGDPLVEGVVDVGYGHVIHSSKLGTGVTIEQATQWLYEDINIAINGINNTLPNTKLTQNQFDALISIVYNMGIGKMGPSTMFRLLRNGAYEDAAGEFPKWKLAGGKPSDGLLKRRRAEQAMFLHGDYSGRP